MTVIDLGRAAPPRRVPRSFYLAMSLTMAAVIVAGFSQTVPGDFALHPGLPWLLHLHGAVFTLWVLLFVAQPALIFRGSVALHRRIGWAGAVLAGAMVAMGWIATVYSIHHHRVARVFAPDVFLVMNGVGVLIFASIVAAGVALRRDAEWHKRLMLMATLSIIGPGLGRFLTLFSLGAFAPFAVPAFSFAFLLAGPVADLIVRRRVHPAYLWSGGVVVAFQAAIAPLAAAAPVQALVRLMEAGG